MPLQVNVRHLETKDVHLEGELPVAELELPDHDELVHPRQPVQYDLTAEMMDSAILVQGRVEVTVDCECARCLKPFEHEIVLEPWAAHVPLEGEDKAPIKDDCVDLTPFIREDILLELPQHPLCEAGCEGLPFRAKQNTTKAAGQKEGSSAWSELNKLKF